MDHRGSLYFTSVHTLQDNLTGPRAQQRRGGESKHLRDLGVRNLFLKGWLDLEKPAY